MGHHQVSTQKSYSKSNSKKTKHNYGGVLRSLKSGRGSRPLSSRDPLHVVYKADRSVMREKSFRGCARYRWDLEKKWDETLALSSFFSDREGVESL